MDVHTLNANGVQLPPEVCELVVTALGTDYATAHALSLTNRAWSEPARTYTLKHKFRRLLLRSAMGCAQLLALMNANPAMAAYMRTLALDGPFDTPLADTPAFGELCARLSALEVLEVLHFWPLPGAASIVRTLSGTGVRPTTIRINHYDSVLAGIANFGVLAPLLHGVTLIELENIEFLDTADAHNAEYLAYNTGWAPAFDTPFAAPGITALTLKNIWFDVGDVPRMHALADDLMRTFPSVRELQLRIISEPELALACRLLQRYGAQLRTLVLNFEEWADLIEREDEVEALWESAIHAIDLSPNTGLHTLELRGIRPVRGDPDWLTPVLARLAAPALHRLELALVAPLVGHDGTLSDDLDFSLDSIAWAAVDDTLHTRAPALEHLRVHVWRELLAGENHPMSEHDYEVALKAKMPGMARILSVPDVYYQYA